MRRVAAPFVSARAEDAPSHAPEPELCGTNSLCNMSTDKLAGNYRRRRSLLSWRGRGASPYGVLWITAGGIFFPPQWNSKRWHLKRKTKFPPIGILMRPCVLFLGERHASRSLVTANVIAVIEFQKGDRTGGQSQTVDFDDIQLRGGKKRHIFVCDKHDFVPFCFIKTGEFKLYSSRSCQPRLWRSTSCRKKAASVHWNWQNTPTLPKQPALSWMFWCFLYRPTQFGFKLPQPSNKKQIHYFFFIKKFFFFYFFFQQCKIYLFP